jgi:hypothetical protein
MGSAPLFHRLIRELRTRFLGQEITVYPTYGYTDPDHPGTWTVPIRVWVHDNRDTPFAEQAFHRWAIGYFEEDLKRPLSEQEKARLARTLAPFIADDKGDEEVEFLFADDPHQRVFGLARRTSPNGIIEESIQVPEELVEDLYRRRSDGDRWLQIHARTRDGNGTGTGCIRFLAPEGLSVISDIDDTIKVTHVPVGKKMILQNTFLKEFQAASGMKDRYQQIVTEAGPSADVCFHYISGSPWQLFALLSDFLTEKEGFPPGTFHMKNLRKNLLETGALESLLAFALGGDLATLDQKIRQITNLMIHLPRRRFILVGDSGEKDPEVYRAIKRLFPDQVERILIRDVLGERLSGMERITGEDVAVFLDTSELEAEMMALVAEKAATAPESQKL